MIDSATDVLGIFARQPIAGKAKTRLAEGASAEWAQRVAEALLGDWLERLADLPARRVIAHAPATADAYFATWAANGYESVPQAEGDLGDRLRRFFAQYRERGFARIVVVGSDSPTVPIAYIEQAFQALRSHEVVIGPAFDGGYYLIGSRADDIPLFESIPWSTARVLETTIQRLQDTGVRLALLPPWYDVDTINDWAMLRGHVLAMRQAGVNPRVPRIERLIRESNG